MPEFHKQESMWVRALEAVQRLTYWERRRLAGIDSKSIAGGTPNAA
jgi:hypothetical protein